MPPRADRTRLVAALVSVLIAVLWLGGPVDLYERLLCLPFVWWAASDWRRYWRERDERREWFRRFRDDDQ